MMFSDEVVKEPKELRTGQFEPVFKTGLINRPVKKPGQFIRPVLKISDQSWYESDKKNWSETSDQLV